MSDFATIVPWDLTAGGHYGLGTALVGLQSTANVQSTAWPSANQAIFAPMRLAAPVTVYKLIIGAGGTASGNFDAGIYDRFGNRLVSSGATAKGTNTEHILDITDTQLGPGLYYLALAADGTNNYIMLTPAGVSPVPLQKARLFGTLEAATAYTLPSTVTFAARTTALIPAITALFRSY